MGAMPFDRIAIVGSVAAGKSTLARKLAAAMNAKHLEIDAIRYGDNWGEVDRDELRTRVVEVVGSERWIVDGNYAEGLDLICLRAQLLVWLDYSLLSTLAAVVARSTRRLLSRERVSGGQRESMRRVLGPNSIVWWAFKSHGPRRQRYEALVADPRYRHLQVARLRRRADVSTQLASWLSKDPESMRGLNECDP